MLAALARLFVATPLYPYWLHSLKYRQANGYVFEAANFKKGRVLEVGAGDGTHKAILTKRFPRLNYVATDYNSWDSEFASIDKMIKKYGVIAEVVLGYQQRATLDGVCDAMNLPYEDNSFDYHLSFETLEHLDDPHRYYQEAARVLKKNGLSIVSVPYLFRQHGGEPDHKMDYFRYSKGFFHDVASRSGFKVQTIYSNTGLGTSVAVATNQWLILRIREANILLSVVAIFLALPTFLLSNLIGYLLDIWPDTRFSTHWHVILVKR